MMALHVNTSIADQIKMSVENKEKENGQRPTQNQKNTPKKKCNHTNNPIYQSRSNIRADLITH